MNLFLDEHTTRNINLYLLTSEFIFMTFICRSDYNYNNYYLPIAFVRLVYVVLFFFFLFVLSSRCLFV